MAAVTDGLRALQRHASGRALHVCVGTGLQERDTWYHAAFYLGPGDRWFPYNKVNLATHERGHFRAGDPLPVLTVPVGGGTVRLGIQLRREIRFPGQCGRRWPGGAPT